MLSNHIVILSAVLLAQNQLSYRVRWAPQQHPRNMDRLNKGELTLHLRSLGETAPESWGKLELQQRIRELAEANPTLAVATPGKTPLEILMSKITKASRKKSHLCWRTNFKSR